jgi:hypothetical protein
MISSSGDDNKYPTIHFLAAAKSLFQTLTDTVSSHGCPFAVVESLW